MKLLLFDIDGTLMLSGGAGARALTTALFEVYGIPDGLAGVRLHGMTDPQIVLDALAQAGITEAADEERLARVRERYLERLASEIVAAPRAAVLPGVEPLLEALAARTDVVLGLVTGNFEPGARIKLGRFHLNRFFPTGGFGSDSRVRRDLVPIAIARAREAAGRDFPPADVVVIGDTEMDVDCGRHAGARTMAVATGGVTAEVLRSAGADRVVGDFTDTAAIVDALLGI